MNNTGLAILVIILAGFAYYLEFQGKLVPAVQGLLGIKTTDNTGLHGNIGSIIGNTNAGIDPNGQTVRPLPTIGPTGGSMYLPPPGWLGKH